ncbi:hypothetical protein [Streptomyces sp. CNQ085]|uniref:hypothetical protein n=1 Tax=Streptomyces sp. CNQ085 TaxID=2886944 RepID=UPI001F50D4F4|nr:hypothetical protein [Streptomyces sp. CNQ085]MCI0387044.1 hypothetical protein [Streptomyces sp. CNQ085]
MPLSQNPADRIAAVHRHGGPITDAQRAAATALLSALVETIEAEGFTLADFDAVVDLPGGCLDVILSKTRR